MDHLKRKVLENLSGSCKELLLELKRWAGFYQTSFFLPLTLQGNFERQALITANHLSYNFFPFVLCMGLV